MKTHTQNSPQSVRGLRERRSLRGLLDTRRMAEADLRHAEYVGPFGSGFHKVKNPGGGEDFIVADQTGGRTFSPGTSIILGSTTGLPGEVVLGGSPPGRKGGVARRVSPRRRGTAVASNQYAFGFDALGDLTALLYSDATYISTRGSSAGNDDCVVVGCILTDPTTLVGDGSALLYDETAEEHRVWDVDGGITYSYSAPAGWALVPETRPAYYAGAVYWVEYETGITGHVDATGQFRLRTAATDLSGESTVATVTMTATDEAGYDHFHDPFMHSLALMVDADGAVVYAYADPQSFADGLPSSPLLIQYRIALVGGAVTSRTFDADTYPIVDVSATNYPTAGSPSGGFALFDGTYVYAKTDDATNEATLLYTLPVAGLAYSVNYSPAGTALQVYSGNIYRNNVLVTDAVGPFDSTFYPDAMFYYGTD